MTWLLPPVLVLFLLIAMAALTAWFPVGPSTSGSLRVAGIAITVLALVLIASTGRLFSRRRTNIHTFKDPNVLVTEGAFRFSRNPIYLGFAILLLGAALATGTASALFLPSVFVVIANRWYIPFEEARMEEAFGEEYIAYKKTTRRWL